MRLPVRLLLRMALAYFAALLLSSAAIVWKAGAIAEPASEPRHRTAGE